MSVLAFGERPVLCRGLAVVPVSGGLVIDGGPQRQQFTGAAATTVLPRLLEVLDGTRTRADLCAELGLHHVQLQQMLGLLADRKLLEQGERGMDGPAVAYLSRIAPIHGLYRSGEEAWRALTRKRVLIAAPTGVAERVAADLEGAGVGFTACLDRDTEPNSGTYDLVIVHDDGDRLERMADSCAQTGTTLLRIASRADSVEIGPQFMNGHTACVACFRTGYLAIDTQGAEVPGQAPQPSELLSSLAVGEALALAGLGSLSPAHALRRVDRVELSEQRFTVLPEADCPRCGVPGRSQGTAQLFDDYEWEVEARPVDVELPAPMSPPPPNPLFHQLDYATSPRRPLAETDATLEMLLSRSAGPKPGTQRRWAPTGGNLGSVEMFVLADGDLTRLPGNVFKYDADAGNLIAARADDVPWERLVADAGLPTVGLRAAFVFCGALWRITPKYTSFALRLTHLDTGCAVAQFALLAQEAGWDVALASGWTGELVQALELDPRREVVTAVAALYRKGPDTDARDH